MRWLQRKPLPRLNDSISSISAGIIEQAGVVVTGSVGVASYAWIYEHWRFTDLHWNSALTWWLAFLGVDLGYYWVHRMSHGELTGGDMCTLVPDNIAFSPTGPLAWLVL